MYNMMQLLVAGVLFFILSPGVLLTIPPRGRGLFLSGQTSIVASAVHAVVFMGVLYLLMNVAEGFVNSKMTGPGSFNQCAGKPDYTNCKTTSANGKPAQGECCRNTCVPKGMCQ
jgi:hypothetical protein